ncbi:uncharacterized protein C20orf85-like [Acyrthosiphon pisum]|uniref:Uncharacterized protein n=1 Tax=Acyrthosiphon pisum TaxID=7029 RepID=A0A8R2D267_ACYPI|nr:uncharacterized protein C20orf85-like [Acyrthosiphon pisum]|eukprot:XP_016657807.1 PREDICTED: uncharacterized protein C20orf85-like [Acyrthosiphon pisum]
MSSSELHKEPKQPNNNNNSSNNKNNNVKPQQQQQQERKKNKKIDKVQCDGRLKIIINRENELRARWPERWGFYSKNNVEKMWSEHAVSLGLPENFIDLRRQKLRKQDRIQPLIDAVPSPLRIPITSSGFIGWRSAQGMCNLEMFGRTFDYNKLDTRMLKPDNEPDQKQQRFIILG